MWGRIERKVGEPRHSYSARKLESGEQDEAGSVKPKRDKTCYLERSRYNPVVSRKRQKETERN